MFNLFPFGFLASLFSGAQDKNYRLAVEQTYDLVIVNRNITPDGRTRPAVLAGGTFPGPTISGEKGDTFVINVINDLTGTVMDNVTSIHWHGIDQYNFNAADGVAFVTQCPIIPGNEFQYKFTVPTQTGTYWYHSHYSNQYCDGLRGAFVIRDPEDPQAGLYDVDDDSTVITLADWYLKPSTVTNALHNAHFVQTVTTLINGVGRYLDGPASPLAIVNVQQKKKYRFRLISISCEPNFKFSIDNHTLTIIEVDGTNAQPHDVDQIQIFAGQRYSFVLDASQRIDNYWIRALPNLGGTTNNGINAAILHYIGASLSDPTTHDTSGKNPLVETDLHPLVPSPVPGKPDPNGADLEITLNVTFDDQADLYCVNDFSFENPTVPVLLQILSGTTAVGDLLPKGSIYGLNRNDVVQLTIPAKAAAPFGGPHPVHLHGHSFYVVRSAGNSTPNWDNPIIRDVVSIGTADDDEVIIRFVADNPGPWFFHCHIDWHLASGFAVVFVEDILDVPSSDVPPPAWSQLCPAYSSYATGTSAVTSATHVACSTSTQTSTAKI